MRNWTNDLPQWTPLQWALVITIALTVKVIYAGWYVHMAYALQLKETGL